MSKAQEGLVVLEEGVKAGVVQACCTEGSSKIR